MAKLGRKKWTLADPEMLGLVNAHICTPRAFRIAATNLFPPRSRETTKPAWKLARANVSDSTAAFAPPSAKKTKHTSC